MSEQQPGFCCGRTGSGGGGGGSPPNTMAAAAAKRSLYGKEYAPCNCCSCCSNNGWPSISERCSWERCTPVAACRTASALSCCLFEWWEARTHALNHIHAAGTSARCSCLLGVPVVGLTIAIPPMHHVPCCCAEPASCCTVLQCTAVSTASRSKYCCPCLPPKHKLTSSTANRHHSQRSASQAWLPADTKGHMGTQTIRMSVPAASQPCPRKPGKAAWTVKVKSMTGSKHAR